MYVLNLCFKVLQIWCTQLVAMEVKKNLVYVEALLWRVHSALVANLGSFTHSGACDRPQSACHHLQRVHP